MRGAAEDLFERIRDKVTTGPVPDAVAALVAAWRSTGNAGQAGISWPRRPWSQAFPAFERTFVSLPELLDRETVRQACLGAADSPTSATSAFLVVMAWGFGSVGYGRYRTQGILANTPDAGGRLHAVARTLAKEGADGAYRRLARPADCQLRGLGPAFGTKFLYFCQPPGQTVTALILDQLVSIWLARNTGVVLDSVTWSPPTYRRYLSYMHAWAAATGCLPDELELCMFREIASERGTQWA
jgi:hypothetical protein